MSKKEWEEIQKEGMDWPERRVEEMNDLDATWKFRMDDLEYLLSDRLNRLLDRLYCD